MIDESDCTLYELFAPWTGGDPTAGSGAIFPLEGPDANDLRPAGWTSADAAGLSIFAGLLRPDEVEAGLDRPRDPDDGRVHGRPVPVARAALDVDRAPRRARRWARGSG